MINNTKVVGLCITRLFEQVNFETMKEINRRCVDAGYKLMIFHCCFAFFQSYDSMEEGEARLYEALPYDILDALIVCEETYGNRQIAYNIIENAKKHNIPVFSHGIEHKDCVTFYYDYVGGFEKVVRHVIEDHKVTRPFFMSGMPDNSYSEERKEVIVKVCKENNVEFDETQMVDYGYYWDKPTREAMERLLEREELPDAIICANDIMAATTCEVLGDRGIKVPEDIIVTGFDGIENIYYGNPQITSAFCSPEELADNIMTYVIKALEEGIYSEERIVILPQAVILESCGCSNHVNVNGTEKITYLYNMHNEYMLIEQKLATISSKIQGSKSLDEINMNMREVWFNNTSVLISEDCLDDTKPFKIDEVNPLPSRYVRIYEYDNDKPCAIETIDGDKWIENFTRFIDKEEPLVFDCLHINECYLGIIAMHTNTLNMDVYFSLYQMVVSLRGAFVGYQREKYQDRLSDGLIELYKKDSLTGFNHRKTLEIEYNRMRNELADNGGIMTVLLADLDGLKIINDKFGHNGGDNAISVVADALRVGAPRGSILIRYGGDELLILYRTPKDMEETVLGNIRGYLDRYNKHSDLAYEVSASIGVVKIDKDDTRTLAELIDSADVKMYTEKNSKKVARKED